MIKKKEIDACLIKIRSCSVLFFIIFSFIFTNSSVAGMTDQLNTLQSDQEIANKARESFDAKWREIQRYVDFSQEFEFESVELKLQRKYLLEATLRMKSYFIDIANLKVDIENRNAFLDAVYPYIPKIKKEMETIDQVIQALQSLGHLQSYFLPNARHWLAYEFQDYLQSPFWETYIEVTYFLHTEPSIDLAFPEVFLFLGGRMGDHARANHEEEDHEFYPLVMSVLFQSMKEGLLAYQSAEITEKEEIKEKLKSYATVYFSMAHIYPHGKINTIGVMSGRKNQDLLLDQYKKAFVGWMIDLEDQFQIERPEEILVEMMQMFPEVLGSENGPLPMALRFYWDNNYDYNDRILMESAKFIRGHDQYFESFQIEGRYIDGPFIANDMSGKWIMNVFMEFVREEISKGNLLGIEKLSLWNLNSYSEQPIFKKFYDIFFYYFPNGRASDYLKNIRKFYLSREFTQLRSEQLRSDYLYSA